MDNKSGPPEKYYIDPELGDDIHGDGTKEKPFKTYRRLQAEPDFLPMSEQPVTRRNGSVD